MPFCEAQLGVLLLASATPAHTGVDVVARGSGIVEEIAEPIEVVVAEGVFVVALRRDVLESGSSCGTGRGFWEAKR
jgi:hypothetical protein